MNPTILDRLLAISSLFQRDMQRSFAGTTLSEQRVHLLWVLFHTGPSQQRVLAEVLGTTPRSVSALVDGLETTGYVRREADPADRRAVLVTLTEVAVSMMWRMQEDHARLSDDLIAAVDPEDREAFERGTNAVLRKLDELVRGDSVSYRDVETGERQ